MSLSTYTPSNDALLLSCNVNLVSRGMKSNALHLTLGEHGYRILDFALYLYDKPYTVPEEYSAELRIHKDIVVQALGINQSNTHVYFPITEDMTKKKGKTWAVVSLLNAEDKVAATSNILINITS